MSTGAPFTNIHVKRFPVRAAIDIGTQGLISLAVGRVDTAHNALRDLMCHMQQPLRPLPLATRVALANNNSSSAGDAQRWRAASRPVLDEAVISDVVAKMRLFHGVLRRDFEGLTERAALITWPLAGCEDAPLLAARLAREFKIDVRVLGRDFAPSMRPPPHSSSSSSSSSSSADAIRDGVPAATTAVRALATVEDDGGGLGAAKAAAAMMECLWFSAFAAASQCLRRDRMLAVVEDAPAENGSIVVVATEPADTDALDGDATAPSVPLLRHVLPISVADAHRLLITQIQRRGDGDDNGDLASGRSPNPVTRGEYTALRNACRIAVASSLPSWLTEKAALGGVICGASVNGGLLNTAARVAGQSMVSVERVDQAAEFHYCGLTDVLIGHNYPHPRLVIAQAALACALLLALRTPRLHYLPNVSVAMALLVATQQQQQQQQQQPLWTVDRRQELVAALEQRTWFTHSRHRTFKPPAPKTNRAAPSLGGAESAGGARLVTRDPRRDPLSYANALRGM